MIVCGSVVSSDALAGALLGLKRAPVTTTVSTPLPQALAAPPFVSCATLSSDWTGVTMAAAAMNAVLNRKVLRRKTGMCLPFAADEACRPDEIPPPPCRRRRCDESPSTPKFGRRTYASRPYPIIGCAKDFFRARSSRDRPNPPVLLFASLPRRFCYGAESILRQLNLPSNRESEWTHTYPNTSVTFGRSA